MIPQPATLLLALAAGLLRAPTLRAKFTAAEITITADRSQYARLIGKHGRHILSLERIASAFGYTILATEPYDTTPPPDMHAPEPITDTLRDLLHYTLAHYFQDLEPEVTMTLAKGILALTVISPPLPDTLRDAIEAILHSIARTDSRKISIAWLN